MHILIVVATEKEIAPLLKQFSVKSVLKGIPTTFRYKDIDISLLLTGIGMTATGYYLGKVLNNKYDMAFNFGLAGSFNRNVQLGEVVNITKDHFSELGAEDGINFLSLKEMQLEGEIEVVNGSHIKNKILEKIPMVCGITVNTVHGNTTSIEKIFSRYHPDTESMEGAAFLFACKSEGIPCAQVRAISNYVELRNKEAWNISLAIKNLNETAIEVLDNF